MGKGIFSSRFIFLIAFLFVLYCIKTPAQFIDDFNSSSLELDSNGVNSWKFFAEDGNARIIFISSGRGYAIILVHAAKDKRGIWWALIKRCVSGYLNLSLLRQPGFAIRIESRVRISDAPKRINLSINTRRTTDFHKDLMEFDIPKNNERYPVSMTLQDSDAVYSDTVYAQLAIMDWRLKK